jgi:hypothetical protein
MNLLLINYICFFESLLTFKSDTMRKFFLLGASILFAMTACNKANDTSTTPTTTATQSEQSGSDAADKGVDDVNDFVSNQIGGGANHRQAKYDLPCGVVSVDSTVGAGGVKTYSIKYGKNSACGYRYKSGTIVFHRVSGATFAAVGAVNSITFVNYAVQSNATNDIVTLNGTVYTTNVTGGYIWETVYNNATRIHKIRGNFTTTYGNGVTRTRSYYQQRTWSSSNGWAGLNVKVAGDTLIGSMHVSEIGKTYDGNHDYKTEISEDFVWGNCGTTYAGSFLLKDGTARLNADIPNVNPAYFQIEAGYYYSNAQTAPTRTRNCSANAYKITTQIGTTNKTEYQQY